MSDTRSLKDFLQANTRKLVPSPTSPTETVKVLKVTRTGWTYQSDKGVENMEFRKMKTDQISKVIS